MTDPKSWSWFKNGRPPDIATIAVRKPPAANNPSLISQLSKQRRPITLAKVWSKG